MIVTQLEEITKNRYKVFLDEQFAFVLYRGELSRFHITLEQEITAEDYQTIKSEVIHPRAKKRLLHLLDQMPRTEQQLRIKMEQNFYTEDVIEEAINYAKSFGYINDKNYIYLYIQDKLRSKSRQELFFMLLKKGIDKTQIEEVLDDVYEGTDEMEAIRNILRKKRYYEKIVMEKDNLHKEKQKIYASLMRKGFSYDMIRSALEYMES